MMQLAIDKRKKTFHVEKFILKYTKGFALTKLMTNYNVYYFTEADSGPGKHRVNFSVTLFSGFLGKLLSRE